MAGGSASCGVVYRDRKIDCTGNDQQDLCIDYWTCLECTQRGLDDAQSAKAFCDANPDFVEDGEPPFTEAKVLGKDCDTDGVDTPQQCMDPDDTDSGNGSTSEGGTTGSESSTTGGESNIYNCNLDELKIGTVRDCTVEPFTTEDKYIYPVEEDRVVCVVADTPEQAREYCRMRCWNEIKDINSTVSGNGAECLDLLDTDFCESTIPDDMSEHVVENDLDVGPKHKSCQIGYESIPVDICAGDENPGNTTFALLGGIMFDDGTQVTVPTLNGSILYDVGECKKDNTCSQGTGKGNNKKNDVCDLTIRSISMSGDFSGSIVSADGLVTDYDVIGYHAHLDVPIEGMWYKKQGAVVFPEAIVTGEASAAALALGGEIVASDTSQDFIVHRLVGTLQEGGPLFLSATCQADSELSLSADLMTTRAAGSIVCECTGTFCEVDADPCTSICDK